MKEFIDRNEIADAVGEYYDFENATEKQWNEIDHEIRHELLMRGIDYANMNDTEYDQFCAIADGVCSKVGVPQW